MMVFARTSLRRERQHAPTAGNRRALRVGSAEIAFIKAQSTMVFPGTHGDSTRFTLALDQAAAGGGRRNRTFSINSVLARRTEFMQCVTPTALSVVYSVVEPNGDMPLQSLVDHRVVDGMATRRVASDLLSVLDNEMVMELNQGSSAAEVACRRSEKAKSTGSNESIRCSIGA
jgi:hypothetical protein